MYAIRSYYGTAYFVKANRFSRKAMESLMADANLRPGIERSTEVLQRFIREAGS